MRDNVVVESKAARKHGYTALKIGAVDHERPFRLSFSERAFFVHADVPAKRVLREFRVTEDALLPAHTVLTCEHFAAGQFVDVSGVTKGKGFAGVMKRHGMKGQPASHGVSKTHRKMGASGGSQDPGRIWKGKRMAGRMGGKTRWAESLLVYKIDPRHNLIFVHGCVPGPRRGYVRIRDAWRGLARSRHFPPFPTCAEPSDPPRVTIADHDGPLPFNVSDAKDKLMQQRADEAAAAAAAEQDAEADAEQAAAETAEEEA